MQTERKANYNNSILLLKSDLPAYLDRYGLYLLDFAFVLAKIYIYTYLSRYVLTLFCSMYRGSARLTGSRPQEAAAVGSRLDFHVLAWNPARAFYGGKGAVDLTEQEEWRYYRLRGDALRRAAAGASGGGASGGGGQ